MAPVSVGLQHSPRNQAATLGYMRRAAGVSESTGSGSLGRPAKMCNVCRRERRTKTNKPAAVLCSYTFTRNGNRP